jgi:two-component system KDP operon response regulator KdpE
VAGRPASLTPTEYRLLFELCANSGRALTYDQLLQRVWGGGADATGGAGDQQRVRTFIKDLRNKLGDDARNPNYIFTVPGVGYRAGASSVR